MSYKSEDSWPDWTGETAVIVGTGPSAIDTPMQLARDRARFLVIKSSWRLAPWADVLLGMDRGWWLANQGAESFGGLRLSASPTITRCFSGVRLVKLIPKPALQFNRVGFVGSGSRLGHSGFAGINLAVQFGAKRLVLVGFDMTTKYGKRWLLDDPGVGKIDAGRVEEWRRGLDACAAQFREHGVEVINASMRSALTAYPKIEFGTLFDAGDDQDRTAGAGHPNPD